MGIPVMLCENLRNLREIFSFSPADPADFRRGYQLKDWVFSEKNRTKNATKSLSHKDTKVSQRLKYQHYILSEVLDYFNLPGR